MPLPERFRPSEQDWLDHSDTIRGLYRDHTLTEVVWMMRETHGFDATDRMYIRRLGVWNERKNIKASEKEALCEMVFRDIYHGRSLQYLTPYLVEKLLRHCREAPTAMNALVRPCLRHFKKWGISFVNVQSQSFGTRVLGLPAAENLTGNALGREDFQEAEEDTTWHLVGADELARAIGDRQEAEEVDEPLFVSESDFSDSASTNFRPPPILDSAAVVALDGSSSYGAGRTSANSALQRQFNAQTTSISSYLLSAGEADDAAERLIWSTTRYYTAKLEEYNFEQYMLGRSFSNFDLDEGVLNNTAITEAKDFWTGLKSGIYHLKTREPHLAESLFEDAKSHVPRLCISQPFTLLREFFATLSLANTTINPDIRVEFLELFVQHAYDPYSPDDSFGSICKQLKGPWISDDMLVGALISISQVTAQSLPVDHPEIFEQRRGMIRLLRRRFDFANSKNMAQRMIIDADCIWGRTSEKARLARTELVYIHNDLGEYRESLHVAEDIVYRAYQDDREQFPRERSINAMEDVAWIREKLGDRRGAATWLDRALRGAVRTWGERENTIHIRQKLAGLRLQQ